MKQIRGSGRVAHLYIGGPHIDSLRYARVLTAALLLAVLALTGVQSAHAAEAELPKLRDLRADARAAKAAGTPILVFFAADYCPYCHIVEEDYLQPMFRSGKYRDKILFRMITVDDSRELIDFHGDKVAPEDFAARYGVRLTPQVKFLDANGAELVPGLIGLMTRDFYAGYLEEAIDMAVQKMRAPAR